MVKKRLTQNKPMIRLKAQIKHTHQVYFLYYLNESYPKLSEEILKLTPQCINLFGDFPSLIYNQMDPENNGWYPILGGTDEHLKLWWKINSIFSKCVWNGEGDLVWKESRTKNEYEWLRFLRENDEELDQIFEIEKAEDEKLDKYLDSLSEKELEKYRELADGYFNHSKEFLVLSDIKYAVKSAKFSWRLENDENFISRTYLKYSKLDPLTEFQKDFDSLLEKFYLEREWLAKSVFLSIWNGSGNLQTVNSFGELVPDEIALEIKDSLKQTPNVEVENEYTDKINLSSNGFPLPNPFVFQEQWLIYDSFEFYEEKALEAYRDHLRNYSKTIKKVLKNHNYKENQGDTHKYQRIRWLLWWNIKKWSKDKICDEIEKETRKEKEGKQYEISTINKAFSNFKKYDLPVRRKKRNEK